MPNSDDDINIKVRAQVDEAVSDLGGFFEKGAADVKDFVDRASAAFQQFTSAAQTTAQAASQVPNVFQTVAAAAQGMASTVSAAASSVVGSVQNMAQNTVSSASTAVNSIDALSFRVSALSLAYLGLRVIRGVFEEFESAREAAIKVQQLSDATGVEAVTLLELQRAMADVGAPTENLNQSLSRLTRNMQSARDEHSKQAEAFRELGVSTAGWAKQLPTVDVVIQQLAIHLANSTTASQDMANMQLVAGRNVVALESYLKSMGSTLEEVLISHREYAEAVVGSTSAARELTKAEADLSEQWKTMLAESLPAIATAVRSEREGWALLKTGLEEIGAAFQYVGSVGMASLAGINAAQKSLLSGDLQGAKQAVASVYNQMVASSAQYHKQLELGAEESLRTILKLELEAATAGTKRPPTGETDEDYHGKDDSVARRAAEKKLEGQMNAALNSLEITRKTAQDQEKLEQISVDKSAEIQATALRNELETRRFYLGEMAKLEGNDPRNAARVETLNNEVIAAESKFALASLALNTHVEESKKKNLESTAKAYENMIRAMADMDIKEASRKEAMARRELEEGIANSARMVQDAEKAAQLKDQANEKSSQAGMERYRKQVEEEFKLNLISLKQRDAALKQSFDEEDSAQRNLLNKELGNLDAYHAQYLAKRQTLMFLIQAVNPDDAAMYQKELAQLDAFNATYLSKRQELEDKVMNLHIKELAQEQTANNQTLARLTQTWGQFVTTTGNSFQNGVMSWVKGTKTFQQAFVSMGANMLTSWIGVLLQMGVKWAERQALDLLIEVVTGQKKVANQAMTAAESAAFSKLAAAQNIASSAATGAAGAMAAVAPIPFVGPELAPPAGAAMFGAIMAWQSANAFEGGGLVGSTQMALLHKNEMVLPANLSRGMQTVINNGGGGSGGDTHIHFAPHVSALDSTGMDRVLDRHQQTFIRKFQALAQSGHLQRA